MASSDDESSESSDSDDELDGNITFDTNKFGQGTIPNPPMGEGNLLGIMSTSAFSPNPEQLNTISSSTMDDFKGLVMEPVNVYDPKVRSIDIERDSSAWIQLVRPELCGGLSVQARYLRCATKENELRMRNINPFDSNAVCIQLGFINKKPNSSAIRRIKVLPRSGSNGAKKTLCPPEIMELKSNESTTAILLFQFASMSNREGDIVGRIEVKQGYGGSVPIEFKPSLVDLLRPPNKTISVEEFDAALMRMQGFQRVESSYTTSKPITSIVQLLMKQSSFELIENSKSSSNEIFRLMGLLPANDEPVMVKLEKTKIGGKIIVCCDHVVAINSILGVVKRVVSS
jgi:hypothetical protein